MSVYVFSGKDIYRQEERLASLLKENEVDKDHTVIFDASNAKTFRMDEALMECDLFSLFEGSTHKAVILKEPYFLNASAKESKKEADDKKKNAKKEQMLSMLEQYLKHPNPDTDLIFYCHLFDADSRKKEYKLLKKYNAAIIEFKELKEWEFDTYIREQLKKYGIALTEEGFREIKERVNNDSLLLHRSIEKILLYGEKKPSTEDLRNLVPLNPNVNIFRMSNMFISGNLAGTLAAKDEMLRANYDSNAMLSMLASRIRSIYNMKVLYDRGYSQSMIAARLNQKEYAVKKGLENCYGTNSAALLRYLKELADLDQDIKAGRAEAKSGLEDFLLRNGGRKNAVN